MAQLEEAKGRSTRRKLAVAGAALLALVFLVVIPLVNIISGATERRAGQGAQGGGLNVNAGLLLQEKDTQVAEARRLGNAKDRSAVPVLMHHAWKGQGPAFREACIWALGEIGDPSAITTLLTILNDPDPKLRLAAAEALGKTQGEHATNALVGAMEHPDAAVRLAAAKALAQRAETAATEALAAAIHDENRQVRLAAVRGLRGRAAQEAREALAAAMNDRDPEVRSLAGGGVSDFGAEATKELERTIEGATSVEVLVDSFPTVEKLAGKNVASWMVRMLDQLAGAPGDAKAKDALRARIVDKLAGLGPPVVQELEALAVRGDCALSAKQAAADVLVRFGPGAVKPIADWILAWKLFPYPDELKLWTATLGRMGDPAARAALDRARAQEFFIPGIQTVADEARKKVEAKSGAALPPPEPFRVVPEDGAPPGPPSWITDDASAQYPPHTKFTGELELVVQNAVALAPDRFSTLNIHLEANDGRWEEVWGDGYNQGIHSGLVQEGTVDPNGARFKLLMKIDADPWLKGGRAVWDIDLKRAADGRFEGSHTGTFRAVDRGAADRLSGNVSGWLKPPRPVRVKDFQPLDPRAHPRLLFRQCDLPYLRKKLQTPFGRAFFQAACKSWNLALLGIMHRLLDDKAYADEAMRRLEGHVDRPTDSEGPFAPPWHGELHLGEEPGGVGSGGVGHFLVDGSLAYDLCCDAWPEDFRSRVERRLVYILPYRLLFPQGGPANWDPCSNYAGPSYGSAAVAGAAIWGLQGPEPPKPPGPGATAEVREPPQGFTPGQGVPVVEFQPGRFPRPWLYAGPIPIRRDEGVLAPLGGPGLAKPAPGTAFDYLSVAEGAPQRFKLRFDILPEKYISDAGIALEKLARPEGPSTTVFYCVLRLAKEEVVGFSRGALKAKAWLGGRELTEKDFYRLRPGLYPFLVVYGADTSAGIISANLHPLDSPALADLRGACDQDLVFWKADCEYRQRLGGADPLKLHLFDKGLRRNHRHYRRGIGDGGYQAETGSYAMIASWCPLAYATMYLKMFGRDPSAYPDVTHLMPRRTMQVFFGADGTQAVQKLGSVAGFDAGWCASAFPAVPDKYKPSLLWAWNQTAKVTGEATVPKLFDRVGGGLGLLHTFLHYPLDPVTGKLAIAPAHPSQAMPLTWEARTFGLYIFRSGWEGKDEFIGQAFLKSSRIGGWNHGNAGTFRLYGLGHPWVVGSTERVGFRAQEPCVLLPDAEAQEGACGRPTYLDMAKDGSGIITVDLADVYRSRRPRGRAAGKTQAPAREAPVEAWRAMAFDYSGKSGAPCLFVLIDRVSAGKEPLWQWLPPGEILGNVKTAGDTFTLDYGDASMKATFIAPQGVKIAASLDHVAVGEVAKTEINEEGEKITTQKADGHRSFEGNLARIKATGGELFFLVATFQRGAPPEVKIEGAGLEAKVTVGRQKVRFNGKKIVLGD